MMELWWMRSTPTLPSHTDSLRPGVVAPDRAQSMGHIELNCVLMLNWITWNIIVLTFIYVVTLNWIVWVRTCRGTSTDIPDPRSPLHPIVHRFWQVLRATSRIGTELLYVGSSWSPCFCSAMWGVHRRTSLMSSSLLLQQCSACLVRLTLIVFVMGGRWPYSCYFVGCCLQDLIDLYWLSDWF